MNSRYMLAWDYGTKEVTAQYLVTLIRLVYMDVAFYSREIEVFMEKILLANGRLRSLKTIQGKTEYLVNGGLQGLHSGYCWFFAGCWSVEWMWLSGGGMRSNPVLVESTVRKHGSCTYNGILDYREHLFGLSGVIGWGLMRTCVYMSVSTNNIAASMDKKAESGCERLSTIGVFMGDSLNSALAAVGSGKNKGSIDSRHRLTVWGRLAGLPVVNEGGLLLCNSGAGVGLLTVCRVNTTWWVRKWQTCCERWRDYQCSKVIFNVDGDINIIVCVVPNWESGITNMGVNINGKWHNLGRVKDKGNRCQTIGNTNMGNIDSVIDISVYVGINRETEKTYMGVVTQENWHKLVNFKNEGKTCQTIGMMDMGNRMILLLLELVMEKKHEKNGCTR